MRIKENDKILTNLFKVKSFVTISDVNYKNRVVFGYVKNNEIDSLYDEAFKLIDNLFQSYVIYTRIVFWNKKQYDSKTYSDNVLDCIEEDDELVLLLKFENSKNILLRDLLKRHLNCELAIEPSLNITCYLFSIEAKVLLNIYDDRGADYLVTNDSAELYPRSL